MKGEISAVERDGIERWKQWLATGTAYAQEQATRPSTIGFVLSSNPLALLAWCVSILLRCRRLRHVYSFVKQDRREVPRLDRHGTPTRNHPRGCHAVLADQMCPHESVVVSPRKLTPEALPLSVASLFSNTNEVQRLQVLRSNSHPAQPPRLVHPQTIGIQLFSQRTHSYSRCVGCDDGVSDVEQSA